jgi:hypothetical protein
MPAGRGVGIGGRGDERILAFLTGSGQRAGSFESRRALPHRQDGRRARQVAAADDRIDWRGISEQTAQG